MTESRTVATAMIRSFTNVQNVTVWYVTMTLAGMTAIRTVMIVILTYCSNCYDEISSAPCSGSLLDL